MVLTGKAKEDFSYKYNMNNYIELAKQYSKAG